MIVSYSTWNNKILVFMVSKKIKFYKNLLGLYLFKVSIIWRVTVLLIKLRENLEYQNNITSTITICVHKNNNKYGAKQLKLKLKTEFKNWKLNQYLPYIGKMSITLNLTWNLFFISEPSILLTAVDCCTKWWHRKMETKMKEILVKN